MINQFCRNFSATFIFGRIKVSKFFTLFEMPVWNITHLNAGAKGNPVTLVNPSTFYHENTVKLEMFVTKPKTTLNLLFKSNM